MRKLGVVFKTWMCGGRLEIVPCSHIGHMYRPAFPYTWGDHAMITLIRNCLRVAEVWLDDYKLFFYERIGNMQGSVNIGDISDRMALRERLQCRSFHWYVKEIYPELYVPVNTTATGRISSVAVPGMCIQRDMHWASLNQPPEPKACNVQDQNQHFLLSKDGQFRRDQGCLTFDMNQRKILMKICDDVTSRWEYTKENLIKSVEGQLCVTLSADSKLIHMTTCNAKDPRQQWRWPRQSVVLHV